VTVARDVALAYDRTGAAWQAGPGRIYDRLAEIALDRSPVALAGASVLDVGAGTGAATRAALACGAAGVVAVDGAFGMLAVDAATRPPAAVADARSLPVRSGAFDVVVAAFSLNHLDEPVVALADAARALRPGGAMVVTAYASEDGHPVKAAVDDAAAAMGWRSESWYADIHTGAVPLLATTDRAVAAARDAGLVDARAERVDVPFPDLGPADLVAWRLGMANIAPFVAGLSLPQRHALAADAVARLGADAPPLVRSMIVLTARVSAQTTQ
jgi:ubiquinone/menaquinone biosynthesis C-methylase UbiE